MKPHLLKAARKRRRWSQAKVAEALKIHPKTVFRWEQGQAVPQLYYREQLCALFGKTAQELGLTFDIDENDTVEQASPPLVPPTAPDVPATVIEDSDAQIQNLIVPQGPPSSLVKDGQAHEQERHWARHFFSPRSLGVAAIGHSRSVPTFRPLHRFSWYLLLMLLIVFVAILLPPFIRQPLPRIKEKKEQTYGPPSYTLTIPTTDPSLQNTTQHFQQAFSAVYPQLVNRFALDPVTAVRHVTLTFSTDLSSPANTNGTTIIVNADWIREHPTDIGLLTHELTLLIQAYPSGAPAWFTDGMADYARSLYGPADDDDWSLPNGVQLQDSYLQGGGVAARFLLWLEQYTRLDIVDQLNHALQRGESFSTAFRRFTDQTVDELWSQYQAYPGITLPPQQLYKTVMSRKPLYQSSFYVQNPHTDTFSYKYIKGLYLSNFAIQVDMTIVHGDGGGFIFREEGDINYSLFLFGNNDWYLLEKSQKPKPTQIVANNWSLAINQGLNQTNLLTIIAQKHTFYLYINKQFITKVDDSTSSYGDIELVAASHTKPTDVRFDNLQVF